MPSRRQLVASLGTALAVGAAGCAGSDSAGSDSTDCRGTAVSHGDGDVLDRGVMPTVDGGDVRLRIPLSVETVEARNVERLAIRDAAGDLAFVIPVSPNDAGVMSNKAGVGDGQLRYEQYLGRRPFHGRYEVSAVDTSGSPVDSITIEFNCFPETND